MKRSLESSFSQTNNPPETTPYSTLEEAILSKYTNSEILRLDRLANGKLVENRLSGRKILGDIGADVLIILLNHFETVSLHPETWLSVW